LREVGLLEGAPGSFGEFENSLGEVGNVEGNGSWLVNGTAKEAPTSESWVAAALGMPEETR
jgi:hypothetical protein